MQRIQVHMEYAPGQLQGIIVNQPVALRKWLQLIFQFTETKWTLFVFDRQRNLVARAFCQETKFNPQLSVTDRQIIVIGGSEASYSMIGVIGEAVIFRGFNPPVDRLSGRLTDSPMFDLKVTSADVAEDCREHVGHVNALLLRAMARLKTLLEKDRCSSNNPFPLLRRRAQGRTPRYGSCSPVDSPVGNWSLYFHLRDEVFSRLMLKDVSSAHPEVAKLLLDLAKRDIDEGVIEDLRENTVLLRTAHCLGNSDATFLLSLILSYGIGKVPKNTTESLRLLLTPRWHRHRLINAAAGSKLALGIDGAPLYPPLGFLFLRRVASDTSTDYDAHSPDDVALESVRLTNERAMKEQTDEQSDLFHWIKHQAERNVPWAKRRLAQLWYYGSKGIRRDLKRAASYMKDNANAPDAEPTDHYEYGMMLLKGRGTEKNLPQAKEHLQRAADQSVPHAVNALAWIAERHDKNYTAAIELYTKAHNLGSLDATYNLGIIYHNANFPNHSADFAKAFYYFEAAALRGGTHAGYMVGVYLYFGLPNVRDRNFSLALDWIRYVAEQNVKTGIFLSRAIKAFRKKEMKKSFINFVQAAYCGLEIANFNLGILCEDHKTVMSSFLREECAYFHYNLSIQRQIHMTDGHAHLKMGDCHWFGCRGSPENREEAVDFYNKAALKKGVPQAYFNLGYIAEQGHRFSPQFLAEHGLAELAQSKDFIEKSPQYLALKFYEKCEEVGQSEAQIPCQMAKLRLQMWFFLLRYNVAITFVIASIAFIILAFGILCFRAV